MKVTIIAHPNSQKPRIEKDLLNSIHVYVTEPPINGKANNAIRTALARFFKVKKSEVFIKSGEKSKIKIFEVIK